MRQPSYNEFSESKCQNEANNVAEAEGLKSDSKLNDPKFGEKTAILNNGYSAGTQRGDLNIQTPLTPRIDISCASSSSQHSDSGSSDLELLKLGFGKEFQEGAEDLRSSTEEINYENRNPEQRCSVRRKNSSILDCFRRSSHPANVFDGKYTTENLVSRKSSSHSLCPETCFSGSVRHSSFGSTLAQPRARSPSTLSGESGVSAYRM